MKIFFLSFMVLILSACVFAENVTQEPEVRCDPSVFSIMPWGSWVSEGDRKDYDAFFAEIYECGFNLTGFMPADKVALAKKHGLKTSVEDSSDVNYETEELNKRYTDWAVKLKEKIGAENLADVFQVYVRDEPWIKDAPVISAQSNAVINVIGCKPYVNLNPNYAPEGVFEGKDYDYYLDKFLTECRLDYISYDNYSFFAGRGLDEDRFYGNIESIRNAALKHKVDFVNIILSIAHFNYAEPNDYSIKLQGWSTLAYGGRGLSYFTFSNIGHGNYRYSAYYRNGSRTPLWYSIRDMNYSIHNIMPWYKDLECVNVFHVGNVPKGCKGIESAKVVKAVSCNIGGLAQTDDQPNFLVGEFVGKDGNEYAIIVNKDPKLSINIDNFEFKNGKKLSQIRDVCISNKEAPFTGEARWLAPGQGVLLKGEVPQNIRFEDVTGWKFIKDPENKGEKAGYFKADYDYSSWQDINVNANWEKNIGDYDGYGWYKTKAAFPKGEKFYLYFGGVDEEAWVYINGKLVFEQSCKNTGLTGDALWDKPFVFDPRPFLKAGENDITVRVFDKTQAGGIWKGVLAVYTENMTQEQIKELFK